MNRYFYTHFQIKYLLFLLNESSLIFQRGMNSFTSSEVIKPISNTARTKVPIRPALRCPRLPMDRGSWVTLLSTVLCEEVCTTHVTQVLLHSVKQLTIYSRNG